MSPSPTERFSQLSIESMPPTTRSQSRTQQDDSSTESDDKSVHSDHADNCLRFPSELTYSLENLDSDLRQHVIDAVEELPQIVLQECVARDEHVMFQVSELMRFRIRTESKSSDRATPTCSCGDESPGRTPCRHILWLFDQITSQIFDNRGEVLTLNSQGYSDLLANPYEMITDYHLDILADDLHSRVLKTASGAEDALYNPRRVQEVREILASLHRTPIDQYRPDIFDHPTGGRRVIKRNDLECTIFRMLCQNNEFFQYFLSCMKSDELVNNPFRKLRKRADAVISGLDAFASSASRASSDKPMDVRWCATHLHIIVGKIQTAILRARRPLEAWERQTAARTLLHILQEVVKRSQSLPSSTKPEDDPTLYSELIGGRDRGFAIGALKALVPDGIQPFVGNLDWVIFNMQQNGVPLSYINKLKDISRGAHHAPIAGSSLGSKRQGGGLGGRAKRVK
jgi:hypothetical protein